jgi:hypothetical protein
LAAVDDHRETRANKRMTNLHGPVLANGGPTPDLSLFATVAALIPIVLLAFLFEGAGTNPERAVTTAPPAGGGAEASG